jgi:hypothetical protein
MREEIQATEVKLRDEIQATEVKLRDEFKAGIYSSENSVLNQLDFVQEFLGNRIARAEKHLAELYVRAEKQEKDSSLLLQSIQSLTKSH